MNLSYVQFIDYFTHITNIYSLERVGVGFHIALSDMGINIYLVPFESLVSRTGIT